jgi:hypothetical protein
MLTLDALAALDARDGLQDAARSWLADADDVASTAHTLWAGDRIDRRGLTVTSAPQAQAPALQNVLGDYTRMFGITVANKGPKRGCAATGSGHRILTANLLERGAT